MKLSLAFAVLARSATTTACSGSDSGGGRQSAIALAGDEIHILAEDFATSGPDGAVVHSWRAGPFAPWQSEPVIPPTTSTFLFNLFLFVDGADLVAVASRTSGELLIYRKNAR